MHFSLRRAGQPTTDHRRPLHFFTASLLHCNKKRRVTHCARTSPLPLLPSGPGGVGGITSRRTRHSSILPPTGREIRVRHPGNVTSTANKKLDNLGNSKGRLNDANLARHPRPSVLSYPFFRYFNRVFRTRRSPTRESATKSYGSEEPSNWKLTC